MLLTGIGEVIIEPIFDEMITIPDSKTDIFICTQDVNYENNTYKTKVLNAKNEEVLQNYDIVEAIENLDDVNNMWYEEGVLRIKVGEQYGLVNFSGKEILPVEYQEIKPLLGTKNSLLLKKDNKIGLCDNKGKMIINTEYKEIQSIQNNYQNGYIVIDENNQYGVIDFDAKVILESKYEEIKPLTSNHIYIVKQDGKWQAINEKEEVLQEEKLEDVTSIVDDRLIFGQDKQYGVMEISGEEKIAPQYKEMKFLFGNYYLAKSEGEYGVVNIENETILPFEYTNIVYQKEAELIVATKEGVILQELYNNKFQKQLDGIISEVNTQKGYLKIYVGEEYRYYNFKLEEKTSQEVLTSHTLFLSKKDGKYGYVDKNGNVVVDYQYEEARDFNTFGFAAIKQNGVWGAIDKTGNIIVEPCYGLKDNLIIDFIGKWHLAYDLNSYYYTDQ